MPFHFTGYITLYHYTDKESAGQIIKSGFIRQSHVVLDGIDDAAHGPGVYFTAVQPNCGKTKNQIAWNNYDDFGFQFAKKGKVDYAIKVHLPRGGALVKCTVTKNRDVWLYKGKDLILEGTSFELIEVKE